MRYVNYPRDIESTEHLEKTRISFCSMAGLASLNLPPLEEQTCFSSGKLYGEV